MNVLHTVLAYSIFVGLNCLLNKLATTMGLIQVLESQWAEKGQVYAPGIYSLLPHTIQGQNI